MSRQLLNPDHEKLGEGLRKISGMCTLCNCIFQAAVLELTTVLRGAGQPAETITTAVAAQQQAAPQPVPQAPQPVQPAGPAAPQRPNARYFTVFEFMQRPTMVGVLSKIHGGAARDVFYQKMGRRLTAECAKKFVAVVKEVYVPAHCRARGAMSMSMIPARKTSPK